MHSQQSPRVTLGSPRGSPRSPGANDVSPRCGWTIGLDAVQVSQDNAFEDAHGYRTCELICGVSTQSTILLAALPGSKTRNNRMHLSHEGCRFSNGHLNPRGEVIRNVLCRRNSPCMICVSRCCHQKYPRAHVAQIAEVTSSVDLHTYPAALCCFRRIAVPASTPIGWRVSFVWDFTGRTSRCEIPRMQQLLAI